MVALRAVVWGAPCGHGLTSELLQHKGKGPIKRGRRPSADRTTQAGPEARLQEEVRESWRAREEARLAAAARAARVDGGGVGENRG